MERKFVAIPQPEELSIREKEDAMGAYLMMFAAIAVSLPLPILNLIAAIVYYYVNRKKGRFVHFHLLQSLYSQIPTTLLNIGLVFWTIRIYFFSWELSQMYWGYLTMVLVANVLYIAFSIAAAIKARKGQFIYFVFFGKIAYVQSYAEDNSLYTEKTMVNEPPKL
jgi:uncharacterized membrane protein